MTRLYTGDECQTIESCGEQVASCVLSAYICVIIAIKV